MKSSRIARRERRTRTTTFGTLPISTAVEIWLGVYKRDSTLVKVMRYTRVIEGDIIVLYDDDDANARDARGIVIFHAVDGCIMIAVI